MENLNDKSDSGSNRRDLFKTGLVLAGGALLPTACRTPTGAAGAKGSSADSQVNTRRKLGGTLEVSSAGLGVQNMSRKYTTEVPLRSKCIT